MIGHYTFLPWARSGLANRLGVTGPLRATVPVQLSLAVHQLDGADVTRDLPPRDVQLYGPGDIVGLEGRAVIRTEPRDWATNFEPNYLPAIEFYDEDLPWRYTPVAPDQAGARLSPWIALVALKEGEEFDEGINSTDRPLRYITIKNNARQNAFPDAATLWAWAHVHVNRGLTGNDAEVIANDRDVVAARLAATVGEDADLAYSRIVCPRRLAPATTYHVFLLPAFESGRLAGLGLDPAQAPNATASAWAGGGPEQDKFPIYFRWQFRTGAIGDFEYLVRLLTPRPVDRRVGVRDVDVQRPGANVPGLSDPAFNGVLQLGGALRVPRRSLTVPERAVVEQQENWAEPYPHAFQRDLASLINLADSYDAQPAAQANATTGLAGVAGDPDPIIAPPLYGRWHAATTRLLFHRDGRRRPDDRNWVHELNLDPRFRVPAGFGTKVVQARQEELMAAAWTQVGDVLEANSRKRRFAFAQQAAFVWYTAHLKPLADREPAKALLLTAPVHGRVMSVAEDGQVTLKARVEDSLVTSALVSPAFRRALRPRGPLTRKSPKDALVRAADIVARVDRGEIDAAPPKISPPGVVTVGDIAGGLLPGAVPAWLVAVLRRWPWLAYAPLVIALAILVIRWLLTGNVANAAVVVALGLALTLLLLRLRRSVRLADSFREESHRSQAVDRLPRSPDFTFTEALPANVNVMTTRGATDNTQAGNFKAALRDLYLVVQADVVTDEVGENGPSRTRLDIAAEIEIAMAAIDPAETMPRRAQALVRIPPRIQAEVPEPLAEAMAYPVFDIPMYRPLAELSAELLIPHVNLIANNTVTLLETNQKFIEAYMVGLNHEFARELLWREYPTDQRGSYFRQFWDVSSFLAGAAADDEDLRERLRDIPKLHDWDRASTLGSHDARERAGDREEEVVLVIRGELLKRYPTAVIYARAAQWTRLPNGDIDRTRERTLVTLSEADEENANRAKLRTPLYSAKIDPDIYFLGFDLTVTDAVGESGERRTDPAGWFFVICERPGEPRFGFDETSAEEIVVWNDLGWDRVPLSGGCIRAVPGIAPNIVIPQATPQGQEEKESQRAEDVDIRWDGSVGAAELAYVLYQAPVMVAIHAAEMLRRV